MYKQIENDLKPYLIFRIGKDLFASEANYVRNIIDADLFIKKYMPNVSNKNFKIYGKLVSYVDTKNDIGLGPNEYPEGSCMIIVEINNDEGRKVGFLVSEVKSLVDVELKEIKQLPELGRRFKTKYIEKYMIINGQVVRILNLNKLTKDDSKIITHKFSTNSKINIIG